MCNRDCLNCIHTDNCSEPLSSKEIADSDTRDMQAKALKIYTKFQRYNISDKGKQRAYKYLHSDKGKQSVAKYEKSDKARERRQRYYYKKKAERVTA